MFVLKQKPRINKKTGEVIVEKDNFLDKIYNKIFTKREKVSGEPSSNAIDIPEEFRTDEIKALYENQSVEGVAASEEKPEAVQPEPSAPEADAEQTKEVTVAPEQSEDGADKEQK